MWFNQLVTQTRTIMTITSNKNGNSGTRGGSFASKASNTYTIRNGETYAGEVTQVKDSRFNFRTNCWLVSLPESPLNNAKFQSLKTARIAIESL